MIRKARPKKIGPLESGLIKIWTSGFQNPLAHTHSNMFVDECNED